VARETGIDELQLSMVMLPAGNLSLITPPVGVILFVACRIGDIPVWRMFKAVFPFLVAEALVVFLLALVPELSNLLPALLYSRP
jgi:TRAP-type C4-dicarboxylate transport system permease large subunit